MNVLRSKNSKKSRKEERLSRSTSKYGEKVESVLVPDNVSTDDDDTTGEPTSLTEVIFHFIVENPEAKQEVYERFHFSRNPDFTVGLDPYSIQSLSCDLFICYCDTPLGPLGIPKTFSSKLCAKFGEKFQVKVTDIVNKKFFGEVPAGASFSVKHSHVIEESGKKHTCNFQVLFVVLDTTAPLCAYHSMRSVLLKVLEMKGSKVSESNSNVVNSSGQSSSKSFWQTIDKQASTTPSHSDPKTSSSKTTSTLNRNKKFTITLPVFSCAGLSDSIVVAQMAAAFDTLKYVRSTPDDQTRLAQRYDELLKARPFTDEDRKKNFLQKVKNNELSRRGIIGKQEADWLLNWVADESNDQMQLLATIALVSYMQSERSATPTDITGNELLRDVFKKDRCLRAILDLAASDKVSVHRTIDAKAIKKGTEIGKGGTATVYTATLEGQTVAFKEFTEGTNLNEFRREVAMMRLLCHPCLLNIKGAGFIEETKTPFIVSEYVAKGDLYGLLHGDDAKRPLDTVIAQWATDIACGMHYLHEHGVIHRDLKSLNVLVTEDDRCKIIDYGASRVLDANSNMTGNIGTLSWMAPEMFQSTSYTEKVDVYSYGIVLFELLTGEVPYADQNSFSLPVQVTKGLRPTVPKNMSKNWAKLMTSCWQDKPSRRPSFDKILTTLTTLANEPIGITLSSKSKSNTTHKSN